ncbi:MAG: HIT family hydrolase [Pseudomonadota bacterium]|nr:HIT family hydrolase [Pseudomonadota bacterium]
MPNACDICHRLEKWKARELSTVVHEFKNSLLVVGDHQYFKGYSVLISKLHAREIHDLPEQVQA